MKDSKLQIFSVGYGNRRLYHFIELLKKHKIECVIDIRSTPFSRYRPEFNKSSLKHSLEESGIRYGWKGNQLGGKPKDKTLYTNSKLDYEKVRRSLEYTMGVEYIEAGTEYGFKIAIMCSELDYKKCHRYTLVGHDLYNRGYEVLHIGKQGELVKHEEGLK